MKIKTCFGCDHMTVENGYMVSEYTGWCSGYWSCTANHFYESPDDADKDEMGEILDKMIDRANSCPDYEVI